MRCKLDQISFILLTVLSSNKKYREQWMSPLEIVVLVIFGCFLLTVTYNIINACLEHKHNLKIRWAVKQQHIITSSKRVSSYKIATYEWRHYVACLFIQPDGSLDTKQIEFKKFCHYNRVPKGNFLSKPKPPPPAPIECVSSSSTH